MRPSIGECRFLIYCGLRTAGRGLRTAALILLTASHAEAQTCDCAKVVTPCVGYWSTDAVFVGRVESITRSTGGQLVRFAVLEGFRGVRASSVDVQTGPAGHRCSVSFRTGREYIVYAAPGDGGGKLATSVCSRTRPIEDAAADVSYARALKSGTAPSGSIGGQLLVVPVDLSGKPTQSPRPLQGVTVRVAKNGEEESAITNQGGDFAVASRGAGTYTVRLDVPSEYYTIARTKDVHVADANACAQADITLYDNSRVSGRLVDPNGRPVPGLSVEVATANLRQSRRSITDRNGRFDVNRLPAGRYVVRSGLVNRVTVSQVTLGAGMHAALEDVRLPAQPSYVPVSGFVLRPDGTPAEGARVYLKGADGNERILSEPAPVDFLGRFVIAGVAGADYRLFAEFSATHQVESSDQVALTATVGSRPVHLVVRRHY